MVAEHKPGRLEAFYLQARSTKQASANNAFKEVKKNAKSKRNTRKNIFRCCQCVLHNITVKFFLSGPGKPK